ncbi:type II toxin-antitoxin system death-on-curing family toxin [Polynucleobacter sp. AP-RePozz3-80-G7]|nr:type II toxin-antitoxin system death-on-curing family toxin [Polynucleobacter sp. AP-RePozz3-80-G7]
MDLDNVILIHDAVIGDKELQGLAKDKSLEATIGRIHNRLQYGFISDVFDLAACYATFLAKAHCFNDANKRTAAATLFFILDANKVEINFPGFALGDWIIDIASDKKSEIELAQWLRSQAA